MVQRRCLQFTTTGVQGAGTIDKLEDLASLGLGLTIRNQRPPYRLPIGTDILQHVLLTIDELTMLLLGNSIRL